MSLLQEVMLFWGVLAARLDEWRRQTPYENPICLQVVGYVLAKPGSLRGQAQSKLSGRETKEARTAVTLVLFEQ
jgi:hypothetical protein